MNLKSSYQGFKRTKWDNKTDVQKVKGIVRQYEKLDLPIPKYLQNKKLTNKQLTSALNRIEKSYQKAFNVERDLQLAILKHNRLVAKKESMLLKQGYSQKVINFLKGEQIYVPTSDRGVKTNDGILEKYDLNNYVGSPTGNKNFLQIIKNKTNKLRKSDFLNTKNNNERINNSFYEIMQNYDIFALYDEDSINYVARNFLNNTNVVEREIILNTLVNEFRDKYEGKLIVGDWETNALNKLNRNILTTIDYLKS